MAETVEAEVCYAGVGTVDRITVTMQKGSTIREAVAASGVVARCAIVLHEGRIGIFGKLRPLDTVVRAGDRIEIYRPLESDPNAARLQRIKKTRQKE